jgi:hypothetical protein
VFVSSGEGSWSPGHFDPHEMLVCHLSRVPQDAQSGRHPESGSERILRRGCR